MTSRAFASCVLVLVFPATVWAHGFHAEASVEEGTITLTASFSDDSRPKDAEVTVEQLGAAAPRVVGRGKTDARGVYRFVAPGPGRYRLTVVEAGLHRARVVVQVDAASGTPSSAAPVPSGAAPAAAPSHGHGHGQGHTHGVPWTGILAGLVIIVLLGLGLFLVQRGESE